MCDDSDSMQMTMAVKMKTESLIKDRILEVNTSLGRMSGRGMLSYLYSIRSELLKPCLVRELVDNCILDTSNFVSAVN